MANLSELVTVLVEKKGKTRKIQKAKLAFFQKKGWALSEKPKETANLEGLKPKDEGKTKKESDGK
jgi:hypothetical protein